MWTRCQVAAMRSAVVVVPAGGRSAADSGVRGRRPTCSARSLVSSAPSASAMPANGSAGGPAGAVGATPPPAPAGVRRAASASRSGSSTEAEAEAEAASVPSSPGGAAGEAPPGPGTTCPGRTGPAAGPTRSAPSPARTWSGAAGAAATGPGAAAAARPAGSAIAEADSSTTAGVPARAGTALPAAHRSRSSEARAVSKWSKTSAGSSAYGWRWRPTHRNSSQHRLNAPSITSRHSDGVASTAPAACANPPSPAPSTPAGTPPWSSAVPLISASRCWGPSGG